MGNCVRRHEINAIKDEISLLRHEHDISVQLLRNEIYNMKVFFKPYSCDIILEEPEGPPPYLNPIS
jgi:hypothetical protein